MFKLIIILICQFNNWVVIRSETKEIVAPVLFLDAQYPVFL
jgi:hypothetical protein